MCENSIDHHEHLQENKPWYREKIDLILSFLILMGLLALTYIFKVSLPDKVKFACCLAAYFLAGLPVLKLALRKSIRGDFFNEFVLMTVATIGAFAIGEYEEGVAVMLFYQVGEWFQDTAVDRAKGNIKSLLDIRPESVTVIRNNTEMETHPKEINIDEIILVKAGEKVALDGLLETEAAAFNTAALTGESKPDTKYKGDEVLAGMINLNTVSKVRVTSLFKDSKLSKILEMVQDATARKSQTQLFITKFSKIYVPVVFALAISVCLLPYFFVADYSFREWFYRGLVFLVISCPCALVVSIPLGYFGGIGLASRNGILFKGGNFLDAISTIDTVVMDKTGTLTKGVFEVKDVVVATAISEEDFIRYAKSIESQSTHPIASAIRRYRQDINSSFSIDHVEEIAGHGLKAIIQNKTILAGNSKLLDKYQIKYPSEINTIVDSIVILAIEHQYVGYITVADQIKEEAGSVIQSMKEQGLYTVMLSGDKQSVVDEAARQLKIDKAYGNLLPEDKVKHVQELLDARRKVAFAGDGVNDAPVVALAHVGIAMGGLGADATIETADIVIQNDEPDKILSAIKIGKITRQIVWQNIILALSVKVIVLILGAGGIANLWEAVIADVGVALVAILNAVRIQNMKV
ncbi:cadmium-translocating P-type ATPase [Sphingobacterium sp. SRCM116780]|uniref:heavy metal translocating P-type ATPase n=1 Tax=Sphingobacterium sp. SRCM116780 TaxID=2907623 RepID=UPI001F473710|nr:heavy metal translocating P-type ATPase [Sphingobacterium sp. SRCM116780]UIR55656.1 cadmium-translocating P-type ATPase [Sphingobacterium sp. SRCM116780]